MLELFSARFSKHPTPSMPRVMRLWFAFVAVLSLFMTTGIGDAEASVNDVVLQGTCNGAGRYGSFVLQSRITMTIAIDAHGNYGVALKAWTGYNPADPNNIVAQSFPIWILPLNIPLGADNSGSATWAYDSRREWVVSVGARLSTDGRISVDTRAHKQFSSNPDQWAAATCSFTAPIGGGTVTNTTITGSVVQDQDSHHGPYSVVAGTSFKVVMSGTGDPDLYVQFGAAPTTLAYACRPYLDGPDETCDSVVPAGQTSAYVMVRGFADASYDVALTYTKP